MLPYKKIIVLLGLIGTSVSCELDDPDKTINIDEVVKMNVPESVLADRSALVKIDLETGIFTKGYDTILLSTTDGEFLKSNLDIIGNENKMSKVQVTNKSTIVYLKSSLNVNSNVLITAQLRTFSTTVKVAFNRSYPDDFIIEAEKTNLSVSTQDSATIKIITLKDEGMVSGNTPVYFTLSSDSLGTIPPMVLTKNGIASAGLKIKNNKKGSVDLIVTIPRYKGDSLGLTRKNTIHFE